MLRRLIQRVLRIPVEETTMARRGFHVTDERMRQHLERIGRTFLDGYHLALADGDLEELADGLAAGAPALCGFAFEGAGMALTLLDALHPGRRFRRFVAGSGQHHAYMLYVGAGWACARLPLLLRRMLATQHPLLRWLIVDGYGFHDGYFHASRAVGAQVRPRAITGYALGPYDQGLGRSLWFVAGADVTRIATSIEGFPPVRRADLWSGVGLACAYAGGVTPAVIRQLRELAGVHADQLAQGAAFAAEARQRAGNPAVHTEGACEILCGVPAAAAAYVTRAAQQDLPLSLPAAYSIWRRRIRQQLSVPRGVPTVPGRDRTPARETDFFGSARW